MPDQLQAAVVAHLPDDAVVDNVRQDANGMSAVDWRYHGRTGVVRSHANESEVNTATRLDWLGNSLADVGQIGTLLDPQGFTLRVFRTPQAPGAPIIDPAMARDVAQGPAGAVSIVRHGVVILPPRLWRARRAERPPAPDAVVVAWRRHPLGYGSPRLVLFRLLGNRPRVRKLVTALAEVMW